MRISHKHKFVFIAVPKTGTTSIREALTPFSDVCGVFDQNWSSPLRYHVPATELRVYFEERGWDWDSYFKFGFVRNPWDWMVSRWHFFKRVASCTNLEEDWQLEEGMTLQEKRWLQDVMRTVIYNNPTFREFIDSNTELQSDKLTDGESVLVDFVGKFENLQEDFDHVCGRIKIPKQVLPVRNRTEHLAYRHYYDDGSVRIMRERFGNDIERFGYEF